MAGGSPEHARLQLTFAAELRSAIVRVGKPCNVYGADLRVRIVETDRSTHPDATVVYGPKQLAGDDAQAVVNPTVIVEVLSESTERDDRGEKFAHYRRLPSLQEYVLVSQDARRIEVFRRSPEGWVLSEAGPSEEVELRALGVRIPVDAVYFDPSA